MKATQQPGTILLRWQAALMMARGLAMRLHPLLEVDKHPPQKLICDQQIHRICAGTKKASQALW